jgi:predicted ATPase/DNA-binding SARP family transcriptional activator
VLGPLELVGRDGEPVALRSQLQRRLLAALLLHANRRVSVDALADLLWGEDLPEDVAGAVQTHVSRARRALDLDDLATHAGGYALEVEPGALDSERFESLMGAATAVRHHDAEEAAAGLDEALALWRGPAYVDVADWDLARTEASRLDELRLRAAEERFDALLALGRHEEAVPGLGRLVDEEPLRERPRALLMTALYHSGRQPEALRTGDAFRRLLAEELGLEPSPALRRLEQEILDHRLGPAPPAPEAAVAVVAARAGWPALPRPNTALIGREAVIDRVTDLCRSNRLVTLVGPGGVGKTRVALEVARRLGSEFDGRVAMCELASLEPDADVAAAVATTLDVEPRAGTTMEARLVEALRALPALLVVDNCEHVVAPAAALVERLIEGTATVTVLATSRERLAVRGEQVAPIETLDDEAALALFADRARAVALDFEITEAERADALGVCHRLDGLPLAIELAAARTSALSLREIADALDRRSRLLTGGRRAETRHRSLDEAVRWSYDLLGEDERDLFDRLAGFAGGFTVEAAAFVAGLEVAVAAERVSGLVDRSLVLRRSRDGSSRFALLETVRQFALERLAERGVFGEARTAHAAFFVAFAERQDRELRSAVDTASIFAAVDAELANVRAAHHFLLERGRLDDALRLDAALFWYGALRLRLEALSWAEATVALTPPGHPHLPSALASCARAAWQRGDWEAWASACERGLVLTLNDPAGSRPFLGERALGHLHAGRLVEAVELSDEALALDEAAGDLLGATNRRAQRLLALGYSGRPGASEEAEAWVDVAEARGHPVEICTARYTAGEVALSDPKRARDHFERAREVARASGCRFVEGIAGASAASIEVRHGDPNVAADRYRQLFDLWRQGVVRPVMSTMLRTVAELLHRLGDADTAAVLLGSVLHTETAPVYGEDAGRLSELGESLHAALGEERFAAAVEEGRRLDDEGAFERAAAALG